MDCDLQDPPEIIPSLLAKWNEGADVVLALRTSRKDTGLRRLGFDLFHRFFALLSDFPVEPNTGTFDFSAVRRTRPSNGFQRRTVSSWITLMGRLRARRGHL